MWTFPSQLVRNRNKIKELSENGFSLLKKFVLSENRYSFLIIFYPQPGATSAAPSSPATTATPPAPGSIPLTLGRRRGGASRGRPACGTPGKSPTPRSRRSGEKSQRKFTFCWQILELLYDALCLRDKVSERRKTQRKFTLSCQIF